MGMEEGEWNGGSGSGKWRKGGEMEEVEGEEGGGRGSGNELKNEEEEEREKWSGMKPNYRDLPSGPLFG